MSIEHVSDGCVAGVRQKTGMPKWLATPRIEGDKVPGAVGAEEQIAGGSEQCLVADVGRVFPCDLACFDIDGAEFSLDDAAAALGPGIAFGLRIGIGFVEDRKTAKPRRKTSRCPDCKRGSSIQLCRSN